MFKLTLAQAKMICEYNWVNGAETMKDMLREERVAGLVLYYDDIVELLDDMDLIIDRANDDLELMRDFGEHRECIGQIRRINCLKKLNDKLNRAKTNMEKLGDINDETK